MARFDPKVAKIQGRARTREIRAHLNDVNKALDAGLISSARLAAIRLKVWAEALLENTESHVKDFMADKGGN